MKIAVKDTDDAQLTERSRLGYWILAGVIVVGLLLSIGLFFN
jgi:hypothetical protein